MSDKTDTPRTDALEEKWRYATNAGGNLDEALDDMFDEHGQLEQELAEARKDSERLDYLQLMGAVVNALSSDAISTGEDGVVVSYCDEVCKTYGKTVRQAIDNAMKEGER